MSKIDQEFQALCKKIMTEGKEYENKNRAVKRLQIPSYTFKHSFADGFPAITNKKLYWKGIVTELLWFLRGDNDIEYLRDNGVGIWNKDAYNWYLKTAKANNNTHILNFETFQKLGRGSVGRNYSVQWRDFNGADQIVQLLSGMKKDIMSSRLKVNAWNPAEIFETALPPCHSEFQVIGVPLGNGAFGFELHWNQRSVDTFLGLPFNIASYAVLAKLLEELTGFKALGIEGTLKCVHFYDNQYAAVKELLTRDADTHKNCEMEITAFKSYESDFNKTIEQLTPAHFKLKGYTSDQAIKVEMLAPVN